jgi:hypothetical protein
VLISIGSRERGDIIGILHRLRRRPMSGAAPPACEVLKNRLDQIEILLGAHALEQHGSDHAPPTDDADFHHDSSINSRAGARRL